MTEMQQIPWPKIARLANETMVVTEKIDGSNACIQFRPVVTFTTLGGEPVGEGYEMACQSRNRLITPTSDNAGFAAWAYDNQATLFADLGYGAHFGEWWGLGIQRGYGMTEKRFSLFNTHRWDAARGHFTTPQLDVVPLLWTGAVSAETARHAERQLRLNGSYAAPGFMNPEGVVAYLTATGVSWKITDAKAGPGKHA